MLYGITYIWNLKDKLVNVTLKRQAHIHTKRGHTLSPENGLRQRGSISRVLIFRQRQNIKTVASSSHEYQDSHFLDEETEAEMDT